MVELLALTGFWIFLFLGDCIVLYYGYDNREYLASIAGTILSIILGLYSMSIPFSSEVTNWIMIGLCLMGMVVGILVTLADIPSVFNKYC